MTIVDPLLWLLKRYWLTFGSILWAALLLASINSSEAKTIALGRFYGTPRFAMASLSNHRQWPPLLTLSNLPHSQPPSSRQSLTKAITVTVTTSNSRLFAPNPSILKGVITENPDTHSVSIVLE